MDGDRASHTPLDLRPKKFCVRCSAFHALEDFSDGCERYYGAAPIRGCKTCGGCHPLDRWNHNCMPPADFNRSDLPAPMVIRDGLPGIMHPLTGKPVDSKRGLRADYRRAGVEEVGSDKSHVRRERYEPDEKDVIKDVRKQLATWKSDNLSNDQLGNMLKEAPPSALGMQCGVGMGTTD